MRFQAHFGFGVGDMWVGRVSILEASAALTLVPDGDPLWKTLGGARSLSDTSLMRIQLSFLLSGLQYQNTDGKGKKPQPEKPPPILIVEQRKRAAHRERVRSRSQKRNRISRDDLVHFYQKQAEVGKNGKQHTHLQSVRGSNPNS